MASTDSFHSAYLMVYHAIGRIKTGNVVCGSLMIMALPIGYLVLKLGFPPYFILLTILAINTICHIISWIIVHGYVRYSYRDLLGTVYLRCFGVMLLSLVVPCLISANMPAGWPRLFLLTAASETIYLILIFYVGFSRRERVELIDPLVSKIVKKFRK